VVVAVSSLMNSPCAYGVVMRPRAVEIMSKL
jgi:hypothetical protein